MAEYIDRHALKNDGHVCWHDGKGNVFYEVDHAPIADVVEVVHGEWVVNEQYFWVMCSACGTERYDDQDEHTENFKYCPYCGAKMDGKDGVENG